MHAEPKKKDIMLLLVFSILVCIPFKPCFVNGKILTYIGKKPHKRMVNNMEIYGL